MKILEKIIDFFEDYNIIFLILLGMVFVAALVTRCTYTTSCKHCGYDYENDLFIAYFCGKGEKAAGELYDKLEKTGKYKYIQR